MDNYNFWADLLDAYRMTADWVKAIGIVTMAAFTLGFCTLIFKYRLALYEAERRRASGLRPEPELAARFRRVLPRPKETL